MSKKKNIEKCEKCSIEKSFSVTKSQKARASDEFAWKNNFSIRKQKKQKK